MSWRKEYRTKGERKRDQRKGFVTCLLVNLAVLLIRFIGPTISASSSEVGFWLLFPWIVNLGLIAFTLIFQAQFAVGYLAFIAAFLVGGLGVGVWFVISCFVAFSPVLMFGFAGEIGAIIGVIIFFGLLPFLFIGGLVKFYRYFRYTIEGWWFG